MDGLSDTLLPTSSNLVQSIPTHTHKKKHKKVKPKIISMSSDDENTILGEYTLTKIDEQVEQIKPTKVSEQVQTTKVGELIQTDVNKQMPVIGQDVVMKPEDEPDMGGLY